MTIKFECVCGKRLRAREDMAGRRSVCPRCGSPVGVPSLRPTHAGGVAGPMTPAERWALRRKSATAFADESPPTPPPLSVPAEQMLMPPAPPPEGSTHRRAPVDLTQVRMVFGPDRKPWHRPGRGGWTFESRWYHCLFCPFQAWRFVLCLAAALTAFTGLTALLWSAALDEEPGAKLYASAAAVTGLTALVVLSYAATLYDGVLTSAVTGGRQPIGWPGRSVFRALRYGLRWLAGFLAGPALVCAGGLFYWIHCGDLDVLDWIILGEISLVAVAYALFAQLAVGVRQRLLDLFPPRVADVAAMVGYRGWAITGVAWLLLLGHGALLLVAVADLHDDVLVGWCLLGVAWLSAVFWGVFVWRVLGVWWHYAQPGSGEAG